MNIFPLTVVYLAFFISGCAAVGPNYTSPALQTPVEWTEVSGTAKAAPGLEQTAWWKTLNDPVLNQLMEKTVQGNLDIEQAQARIKQARAELKVAGTGNKPTVNGAGSITRNKESENAGNTGETSTLYTPGFDATWEIDVFGSVRRSVEAAEAHVGASVEDLHDTQLTLLGDVTNYYVQLRAAQEQLAITRHNLEAQTEPADVTRERYRSGLTSYLDKSRRFMMKTLRHINPPS